MSGVLVPVVVVVLGFAVNLLIQRNLMSRYDYRCDRCAAIFSLTPARAAVVPHRMGGTKYVRCPNCGRLSWAAPVPKA